MIRILLINKTNNDCDNIYKKTKDESNKDKIKITFTKLNKSQTKTKPFLKWKMLCIISDKSKSIKKYNYFY